MNKYVCFRRKEIGTTSIHSRRLVSIMHQLRSFVASIEWPVEYCIRVNNKLREIFMNFLLKVISVYEKFVNRRKKSWSILISFGYFRTRTAI